MFACISDHILLESWLRDISFGHQHGCTCAFTYRRMLHTTDPEFPSMIVSGNLPSLTLHVNEQKASTLLSSTKSTPDNLVLYLVFIWVFTWLCEKYAEMKTSNPVFMHWVYLYLLVPHLNLMIRESQTCHYHNYGTCSFGKFMLLNDWTVVLNIFHVLKSTDKSWATINLQISPVCFRWQPWGDVST